MFGMSETCKKKHMRPKQRHIDSFLATVHQGSILGASNALGLSQPAVSRTLAELEEMLGVRLIERQRRGVSLTPEGEVFLRYANACVAALDKGVRAVSMSGSERRRVINVGVLPNVAALLLPGAVNELKQAQPDILVRIITDTNRLLSDELRRGDLDFMVGRLAAPEDLSSLDFDPFYDEDLVLVVRRGHPLLMHGGKNLSQFPLMMPLKGTIIRQDAERLLLTLGLSDPENAIETLSVEFGRTYVSISDVMWMTPRGTVAHDLESGEVIALPLPTIATYGTVGITSQKGARLSQHAQFLVTKIKEQAGRYQKK